MDRHNPSRFYQIFWRVCNLQRLFSERAIPYKIGEFAPTFYIEKNFWNLFLTLIGIVFHDKSWGYPHSPPLQPKKPLKIAYFLKNWYLSQKPWLLHGVKNICLVMVSTFNKKIFHPPPPLSPFLRDILNFKTLQPIRGTVGSINFFFLKYAFFGLL